MHTFKFMREVNASDLPTGAKHLALVLACYSDAKGCCWPSLDTLASDTSLSRRSVQRHLDDLQDAGWVEITQGNGRAKTSRYALRTPPQKGDKNDNQDPKKGAKHNAPPVDFVTQRVSNTTRKGVKHDTTPHTPLIGRTTQERRDERLKNSKKENQAKDWDQRAREGRAGSFFWEDEEGLGAGVDEGGEVVARSGAGVDRLSEMLASKTNPLAKLRGAR